MSIFVRNIATSDALKVSNVKKVSNREAKTRYIVGTRFFNKYGHILQEVERNEEEGWQLLALREGWEMIDRKEFGGTTESEAEEVEAVEEVQPVEVVEAVEDTPQPEQPTPQTTPKEAQAATIATPTQDAVTAALLPLFGGVATQVAAQVESNIMAKVQPPA